MRIVILTLWIGLFVGPFIEPASADAKAAFEAGDFKRARALCVLTRNMGWSHLQVAPRHRALMLRKEMTEEELKRSHPHVGADAHREAQPTLRRAAR
jgi:hypothetical protein